MGQEGERELQAGVEEQVEEVDQALGLEGGVVRGRQILQRGESRIKRTKLMLKKKRSSNIVVTSR